MNDQMGGYAFLAGIVLALLAGIFGSMLSVEMQGWFLLALIVLGLVVGFLNVSDKEVNSFLIAAIALMAVGGTSGLTLIPMAGVVLDSIVGSLAVFVAPAALVVALKSVYSLGKS